MPIFILLCVDVLPASLSVHHLLACCHCKTDKGFRILGTGIKHDC